MFEVCQNAPRRAVPYVALGSQPTWVAARGRRAHRAWISGVTSIASQKFVSHFLMSLTANPTVT